MRGEGLRERGKTDIIEFVTTSTGVYSKTRQRTPRASLPLLYIDSMSIQITCQDK